MEFQLNLFFFNIPEAVAGTVLFYGLVKKCALTFEGCDRG
jgi:hypothetical protein